MVNMVKFVKKEKIIQSILITFLVVVITFSINGQASAETNLVPRRGEGTGQISGYTISNIHYRLAEDPSMVSAVEFDLNGPANQVLVSFDSGPNEIFSCINTAGNHWLCGVDNVKTEEITKISIIAAG